MRRPSEYKRIDIEVSGGRSIRIESEGRYAGEEADDILVSERVWVVSRQDPRRRERLPVPPPSMDADPPNPFPFEEFDVSPDERAVVASRKVCSGVNEAFLSRRVAGLRYTMPGKESLNEQIQRRFAPREARQYGRTVRMVRVQDWRDGGDHVRLSCAYGPRASECWYEVTLDTRNGRFTDYRQSRER